MSNATSAGETVEQVERRDGGGGGVVFLFMVLADHCL